MGKRKSANLCVNVLSTLSHVELLEYDLLEGRFLHLDSEEFLIDPTTRDFLDTGERFKQVIKRLYERNRIPLKTPTNIVVPSFFTRQFQVPESILAEELPIVLTSEAERFYVFKKIDPVIGHYTLNNGEVLYTAYPKHAIDTVKKNFMDLKIPLVSIDCNYTAALRGLLAMGVIQNEVTSRLKWGFLIISDFYLFLSVLEGQHYEKISEIPLPLQNTDEATLLLEIRNDFQQFYEYEVLNRLVIINNSMKIYSPPLVDSIGFQGPTDVFDQNDGTLASRGAKDAPFPCTLDAIGGALIKAFEEIPPLELNDGSLLAMLEDEKHKTLVSYGLIALGVILFIGQLGISSLLDMFAGQEQAKSDQIQASINAVVSTMSIIPDVKQKLFIKKCVVENYKLNNLLIKIDQNLPQDAWFTKITLNTQPDMKAIVTSLKGGTLNADSLNAYVGLINNEIKDLPLTPNVIPKEEENQRYFEFTLSNGSDKTDQTGAAP